MRCPLLADLPPAPPSRSGWPWTKDSPQIPDVARAGENWPRITIVTPSLNQAAFIEETIRSVLLQGYPDLEYIVVDGGSADGCVDIIAKYSPWLAYWVSEPDNGQSDALNKGFARATGQVFGYINSDDLYEPGALGTVAPHFLRTREPCLVAGDCVVFGDNQADRLFAPWWPASLAHLLKPFGSTFAQPSSFWSRSLYEHVGGFDPHLQFVFDREFFLKLGLQGVAPLLISNPISRYRDHPATKTGQTIKFYQESIPLIERYAARCELSRNAARALLQECADEIRYLDTFARWKHQGRRAAAAFFLRSILRSPRMLLRRRVLGLGRRLLFFRASLVPELRNV